MGIKKNNFSRSLSLALDHAADTVQHNGGEGDEGPQQGEKQGDKSRKNTPLITGQIFSYGVKSVKESNTKYNQSRDAEVVQGTVELHIPQESDQHR